MAVVRSLLDRFSKDASSDLKVADNIVCLSDYDRVPDDLPEDQVERLRVIAAKCPVHRALDGEVMFQERIERVHLAA